MSPFAPRKVVFSSRLWLEPTTFRGAKGDIIDLPFPAKGGEFPRWVGGIAEPYWFTVPCVEEVKDF